MTVGAPLVLQRPELQERPVELQAHDELVAPGPSLRGTEQRRILGIDEVAEVHRVGQPPELVERQRHRLPVLSITSPRYRASRPHASA